jgi:hypothetical protein
MATYPIRDRTWVLECCTNWPTDKAPVVSEFLLYDIGDIVHTPSITQIRRLYV